MQRAGSSRRRRDPAWYRARETPAPFRLRPAWRESDRSRAFCRSLLNACGPVQDDDHRCAIHHAHSALAERGHDVVNAEACAGANSQGAGIICASQITQCRNAIVQSNYPITRLPDYPMPLLRGLNWKAMSSPIATFNGRRRIPPPVNDPVRSYAPGSAERASIKARLKQMAGDKVDIPLFIGGKEVKTGNCGQSVMPHDHQHVLG